MMGKEIEQRYAYLNLRGWLEAERNDSNEALSLRKLVGWGEATAN